MAKVTINDRQNQKRYQAKILNFVDNRNDKKGSLYAHKFSGVPKTLT